LFCYSDTEPRQTSSVPYHKQNAVKSYLTHYASLLYLQFIVKNSDDWREREQAQREQDICQRKLKYWTHHANYDHTEVLRGIEKLKKEWA
jgi:hypothetical protein